MEAWELAFGPQQGLLDVETVANSVEFEQGPKTKKRRGRKTESGTEWETSEGERPRRDEGCRPGPLPRTMAWIELHDPRNVGVPPYRELNVEVSFIGMSSPRQLKTSDGVFRVIAWGEVSSGQIPPTQYLKRSQLIYVAHVHFGMSVEDAAGEWTQAEVDAILDAALNVGTTQQTLRQEINTPIGPDGEIDPLALFDVDVPEDDPIDAQLADIFGANKGPARVKLSGRQPDREREYGEPIGGWPVQEDGDLDGWAKVIMQQPDEEDPLALFNIEAEVDAAQFVAGVEAEKEVWDEMVGQHDPDLEDALGQFEEPMEAEGRLYEDGESTSNFIQNYLGRAMKGGVQ